MTDKPWMAPELTSANRLPCNSVPHWIGFRWMAGGASSWLHSRMNQLPRPGAKRTFSAAGHERFAFGLLRLPHYTNVQMPFSGEPLEYRGQSNGRLRARFRAARRLAGRPPAVVLHVGAAESD